jgi:hypothetical protein
MNSLREGPSHKVGKVPNRIDEQTVILSFNPSHENSYGRGNDPIMNSLREGSSHNVGREVTGVDEQDDHSSAASSGDEEQNRVEEEEQTPIPIGLLYPLDSHFLARLNNNTSSVKAVKSVCRAYGLNPNTPKHLRLHTAADILQLAESFMSIRTKETHLQQLHDEDFEEMMQFGNLPPN